MGNVSSQIVGSSGEASAPKFSKGSPMSSPRLTNCSGSEEFRIWIKKAFSRRAYRHHRKRLARIVADQWMYAARFRLTTLKIQKSRAKKIKRFCIAEWKNVVEKRSRTSQILERAHAFYHTIMGRRSLHQWEKFVRTKRILREAFERTAHMVSSRQRRTVLLTLQSHCQAKIMLREQVAKAEGFGVLNLLRRYFSAWDSKVQDRASELQRSITAQNKWTNARLRLMFSAWKMDCAQEKGNRVHSAAAEDPAVKPQMLRAHQACCVTSSDDPVMQAQILTKCFWCWYLLVSQKKAKMEKFGNKCCILAERHYERNLQRAAYDGWRKLVLQSCLAASITAGSVESEAMNRKPLSNTVCCKPSHQEWAVAQIESPDAPRELLKLEYCSTGSRRVWTIGQNDYTRLKQELLKHLPCSTGSRRVWTIQKSDYNKAKNEILKLMYCSKPSSREVAVSWFVKTLVKRFLSLWKEQVLVIKGHRQNNWYAVVHSKMQSILKGFDALRANVYLMHSKQSLQELSVNCYHQTLKRKTVSSCKLLHQSKRVKLFQIEHATAQWRTTRLQERFDKWYLATALRSRRRKLTRKSDMFRNRKVLLHCLRAWYQIKGLLKDQEGLRLTWGNDLKDVLIKSKKLRIFRSWKVLRKDMNIKRFNEARALQFFIGFREARVMEALQVFMQVQRQKRYIIGKVDYFQKIRFFKLAMSTWREFVALRNLNLLATNHNRHRLMKHAMASLIQWEQFRGIDEENNPLQETMSMYRKLKPLENPLSEQQRVTLSAMPARAQPRRPAFLNDDGITTQGRILQGHQTGEDKSSSGTFPERDPNLVAKEVEWMEQILLDYEEIKVQIVELRAKQALLLGERLPGSGNGVDPQHQKITLLQRDISALEAKKMVQMPLIHAVLSRVQDLRIRKVPDEELHHSKGIYHK